MTSQGIVNYVTLGITWHFLALKADYGESLVYGIIRAKLPNNTAVPEVPEGVILVGLLHAPFSAFFEVLAMSLGQICVRGCWSLVNALKTT